MRSRLTNALTTFAAAAVVLTLSGLAYIYSGWYNVAATEPHNAFSTWVLETTQKNSVQAHAKLVGQPPALGTDTLQHGVDHFNNTCVACHGAPGVERGELGKGMTPTPPELSKAAGEWSEQELFWIVKHGIKFAGMPAFGPTHSDEELWALVAFLKRLPQMSPQQYQEEAGSHGATGSRRHGGQGAHSTGN